MARDESNREDLLREATALVERVELVHAAGTHIVAGFRRSGALSIFFGEDPVYQFNAAGELRRAYCKGLLIKADGGCLSSLQRIRTESEVQLVRQNLSEKERNDFLATMAAELHDLREQLAANNLRLVGQVPPEVNVLARVEQWLASHASPPIAQRPNA